MRGVQVTITILIASAVFGYFMAFVAGLCRLSNNVILRTFTAFYVEVFRGTSLIVQLFWLYYALPILFDIHLGNDFWAGVLAIGLNYGAYMSEIVRGSILSVAHGQSEAAIALRMMLPEFGNYNIQMLKATSLVSLIGLTDVLYHADNFRATNMSLAPTVYLLALVFFFILALPLIWFTRKAEKMSKKGVASQ